MKILLIEGDKHLREIYKNFLEIFLKIDPGLTLLVDDASDTLEGLSKFYENQHKVVIINEALMSKKEFLDRINYDSINPKPKIIFLTNNKVDLSQQNGIRLIQKPINSDEFRTAIENVCFDLSEAKITNGGKRKWFQKQQADWQNMEC